MADLRYSKGQRLGFLALILGFLLTLIMGCVPFWKEGKISANDLLSLVGESIPFIGKIDLVTFHGGLFIYCIDVIGDGRTCEAVDFSHGNGRDKVAVFALGASVLLSLLCVFAACCRVCCCSGGRTICHGVMAFFAAGLGALTVALFATSSEESWDMKLTLVTFNWAFYLFVCGVALTLVSSFALCCAYPDSPMLAMLPSGLTQPMVTVVSSHQQSSSSVPYSQLPSSTAMGPPAFPVHTQQSQYNAGYDQPQQYTSNTPWTQGGTINNAATGNNVL